MKCNKSLAKNGSLRHLTTERPTSVLINIVQHYFLLALVGDRAPGIYHGYTPLSTVLHIGVQFQDLSLLVYIMRIFWKTEFPSPSSSFPVFFALPDEILFYASMDGGIPQATFCNFLPLNFSLQAYCCSMNGKFGYKNKNYSRRYKNGRNFMDKLY